MLGVTAVIWWVDSMLGVPVIVTLALAALTTVVTLLLSTQPKRFTVEKKKSRKTLVRHNSQTGFRGVKSATFEPSTRSPAAKATHRVFGTICPLGRSHTVVESNGSDVVAVERLNLT